MEKKIHPLHGPIDGGSLVESVRVLWEDDDLGLQTTGPQRMDILRRRRSDGQILNSGLAICPKRLALALDFAS